MIYLYLDKYPEKECQSWIKDCFPYFLSSCTNITAVFKNIFFAEIHQTKRQTKGCPRFSFFFWNIFNLLYDLLLIIFIIKSRSDKFLISILIFLKICLGKVLQQKMTLLEKTQIPFKNSVC